jgi:hypothetical protein
MVPPGIDGVTAADYAKNLEANLLDLLDRIKSGRYKAPPVRRTYIPKADGSRRPLGIPTFEDKLVEAELSKSPCYPLKISLFFGKNSLLILNTNLRRNRCGAHVSSLCDDLRQG